MRPMAHEITVMSMRSSVEVGGGAQVKRTKGNEQFVSVIEDM
jgi:hypothetical protein